MHKTKRISLLLFFLTLGFILRLNNLSGRSLWTDEFFTFFQSTGHGLDIKNLLDGLARRQPPELLKAADFKKYLRYAPEKNIADVSYALLSTDTHPPFYFSIIHVWMRFFGDGILAVRLFSVFMGILSIFLAYQVGGYLFNREAGICSALFMTTCAFCVRYAQEARAYSLVMALGLLSWIFLLRLERNNRAGDAIAFAILNSLGIYTHYFYFFITCAQFLYCALAFRQDNSLLRKFYFAFLASLLFLSPWLFLVISKGYNFYLVEWVFGHPGLANKVYYLFLGVSRYVSIWGPSGVSSVLLSLIGLCFFVYLLAGGSRELAAKYPRQFLFCLSVFLVPLCGIFFIDILQHGALLRQERFWLFPFLGFIPLAGYALSYGFSKKRRLAYVIVILMSLSSFFVTRIEFGPAPKDTSLWINKEAEEGPVAVIVYNARGALFAQSYYLYDGIYLIPVASNAQLEGAVRALAGQVGKIFIARHYHRTDTALLDQGYMGIKDIGSGFQFREKMERGDISVAEYVHAHYQR